MVAAQLACICGCVCLTDHFEDRGERLGGIQVIFQRRTHFLQSGFRQLGELWAANFRKMACLQPKLEVP